MKKLKKPEKKIGLVIPIGNGWAVKTSISGKLLLVSDNKREAVSIARDIAKWHESKLVIYGKDGNITTTSYVGKRKAGAKIRSAFFS